MDGFSDFLFARPSFLEGVARIFDWSGALNEYNYSVTGAEADALAMRADWAAIGQDFRRAADAFIVDVPEA